MIYRFRGDDKWTARRTQTNCAEGDVYVAWLLNGEWVGSELMSIARFDRLFTA